MPETQYTSEVSQQNLDVVSKELAGTLHDARIALEEFAEDQSKSHLLEKTADFLHAAHGVLRMVEVYGAALLTEEMEKVISYLLEARRAEKIQTDAVEALSRSMLQLPTYLDRVASGGRDIALILLPLLNDLRAVRGKPLLSEGTLLLLNLTPRRQSAPPPRQQVVEPRPDIREVAARVRPLFQTSLLGWIRDATAADELNALSRIAESLEQSATTTEVTQLWAIVAAIIEALQDKGLETSVSLKRLLGQADRQIKRLVDMGEDHGGGEDPAGELRNNLLYYVARATGNGRRVNAIRNLYRLDEVLPADAQIEEARDSLSAPSVKLMRTVGSAIKEDLARVKDVFDIFVRTGMENVQELRPQAEMLKKISDTLGVLGLGELRSMVMNEIRQLSTILDGEEPPDEAVLLQIAATVLKVEDKLDEDLLQLILPGAPREPADEALDTDDEREYRQVSNAVLRECVVNIARIKEAMTLALQKEDFQGMDQVPDLMRGVTAGLLMLGKSRAVGQSEKISALIQQRVQPGLTNLKGEQLDRLADAIVSLEYYMETLRTGRADPWYMLDNVDGCLKVLATPSKPSKIPKIPEQAPRKAPGPDADATQVRIDEPTGEAISRADEELPVLVERPLEPEDERLDPEFLELFIEEARDEITIIRTHFAIWREEADNKEALARMRRSFHTLKGSGRMVGATRIAEFAWISESLLNRLIDRTKRRSSDVLRTLEANIAVLPALLDELEAGTPVEADVSALMSQTQRLTEVEDDAGLDEDTQMIDMQGFGEATMVAESTDVDDDDDDATALIERSAIEPGMDPVLRDIFIKESAGHLQQIRAWIDMCEDGAAPYPITDDLYRACHTLHGSAKMAGAIQGVKIAEPFDRLLRKLHDLGKGLDEDGLAVCRDVVHGFDEIIGHLEEDTGFFPTHRELSDRIRDMEAALDSDQAVDDDDQDEEASVATPDDDVEFDGEIAAIFSEEAAELLEASEQALSALRDDPGDGDACAELQRALHTIKGGARMAGIRAMGDLSHETESLIDKVTSGGLTFDEPVAEVLQAALDALHTMREQVSVGQPAAADAGIARRILALTRAQSKPEPAAPEPEREERPVELQLEPEPPAGTTEPPATEMTIDFDDASPAEPEPEPEIAPAEVDESLDELEALLEQAEREPGLPPVEDDIPAPPVADAAQPPAPVAPPMRRESSDRQEFTRVETDRLDEMLNYAGEISIYRSRLDQQMRSMDFNLAELSRTVIRLRDQLRKLEIETETHILARHHEESRSGEFDPLELDQYSLLQQLSKALAESVNDVASLRDLLESQANESDALLSQQARLTADLQSSLMHTRMVPFIRYEKRLSRIVRQAANDVGKKAQLRLDGASGELDRQVLERMMQPLEHLLRNAVVHGIEGHDKRAAAGKPEAGDICIALQREGSEMIIRVGDDGAGIDADAVRRKAIARGLLDASETLPDEQVRQMIFRPGFSTAGELTQAAGRGVGLDVVATEVERLGGSVHVESEHGRGTQFVIRLPFTLAITQAMVVRVGEEHYALPLPTVEGIARMPRHRVTERLEEDDPQFEYGGRQYRLRHLAHFVDGHSAGFADEELSVSIILVRAGSHSTALVADELLGSREIVVKSVGPQVAGIVGISGGTILGDGSVALILDLGGLVRSEAARRRPMPLAREADTRTFVLVVDDSITVRRVTQRLLERNGMRVITAKDGVDALALLQEHHPDIILLDIEMPRMDGYELAGHIRGDARLGDVPIVMITSRTGRKHRARAIELGVNDYLGKPYQENQLLDAIEPLVRGDT